MAHHRIAGSTDSNSREGAPLLRRIVAILILVTIVMFVVVLKAPFRTLTSSVFLQDGAAPSERQVKEKSQGKSANRPRRTTSTTSSSYQPNAGESNSASEPRPPETNQPPTPTKKIRSLARNLVPDHALETLSDSVALYAINSKQGAVLGVLKKGTVVEPNLQIIDGQDNWSLVRVPELNVVGFVRTEALTSRYSGR
jgi:flagellar basal body-associated protein FliL